MIHFLRRPTLPLKLLATPLLSSAVLSPVSTSHSRNYFLTGSSRKLSSDCGSDTKTSSTSCKYEAVRLKSRSLVKLQGVDTLPFLQGLITNDIHHFESRPAIYALFLNQQGRILWDTLLFNVGEGKESKVFIECDSESKANIIKHFETFKLRKKVEVVDVEKDKKEGPIDLWVVFDHGHTALAETLMKQESSGPTIPTAKRPDLPVSIDPSLRSFGDPRLNELGWRILVPRNKSEVFPPKDVVVSDESSYKKLRYVLGVGEGVQEIPPGASFPLEANGDYLHGISFHKGCYIGQELTARTHHTGVVRKRIMPFRLPEGANLDSVDPSTLNLVSSTASSRSLGKIRGVSGPAGIGLIRIEGALTAAELKIQTHKVQVAKPFWWPKPASKEAQSKH